MSNWQAMALLVGMAAGPALGRWIDRILHRLWPDGGGKR